MNTIFETEHFILYTEGDNNTNIHINSKSKDIQDYYLPEEVMSHEKKIERVNEFINYFYNYWKIIEQLNEEKLYTMYFDINLVEINIPMNTFMTIKKVFNDLKNVFEKNLKESYFKVEHKLAKYFLDIVLTLYKPVKPVHII
jgi:hypothetical protein